MYRVLEVQGTTYTVEPVEGGTVKRVHRSNLRPCNHSVPVPMPRCRKPSIKDVPTSVSESAIRSLEAECVLVKEVLCPGRRPTVAPASEDPGPPVPSLIRWRNQVVVTVQDQRVMGYLMIPWKLRQYMLSPVAAADLLKRGSSFSA